MSLDWSLYESILYRDGDDFRSRVITREIDLFKHRMADSPATKKVLVDGIEKHMMILSTNVINQKKFKMMPGDSIEIGDTVFWNHEHWLVTEVDFDDEITRNGRIEQCNYLFCWQLESSQIVKKWGIFDSGIYSTTVRENNQIIWPDKQYKIFLPFDKDTEKIHLGKRLAVGTAYDKDKNKALVVYKVTGYNPISETYGKGGHLLVLDVRSDTYQPNTDNLELMLCGYIAPAASGSPPAPTALLRCAVDGGNTITAKFGANLYTAVFYQSDGVSVDPYVTPDWTINIDPAYSKYIHVSYSSNTCSVSADVGAVGQVFSITLSDHLGMYEPVTLSVKVVSLI